MKQTHSIEFEPISGEGWEFISAAIAKHLRLVKADRQTATEVFNIRNTIDAHLQKLAAGVPLPKAAKKSKQRTSPVGEIDPLLG